ncbi:sulfotransferase domain-containing protein [Methylosinus sp. KRF6]|nr:sulfotransferase domain-containing protein [Methylosinus sp. KRF6]
MHKSVNSRRSGVCDASALVVDPRKVQKLQAPYEAFRRQFSPRSPLRALAHAIESQFRDYYFVKPPTWRIALRASSFESRMKPSFASIGAVRSGTSLLSSYIFQHPNVAVPLAKELAQLPRLDYIEAQFPSRREQRRIERRYGSAITGYCNPIAPSLLMIFLAKAICPDGRVVVVLRDPVERAFSQWRWDRMKNARVFSDPLWRFVPGFETIVKIEQEAIRCGGGGPDAFSGNNQGYLQQSIYLPFLRLLFEQFRKEQIHIVNAAELFSDPAKVAKGVYKFLELPPVDPLIVHERNASPQFEMPDGLRSDLSKFFRPYNEALYEFVGADFGWETKTTSRRIA